MIGLMIRVCSGVVLACLLASQVLAQQVGVITAHNTNATSSLPSGARSVVQLGKSVFYNQTFATDENGRIQARLLDGSSFTLSSNSSLTIDKFVYDPQQSSGEILANVAVGVVKFIGGELSKSTGQVTVETATASVGIRGGIAVIRVSQDRLDSEFSFHFGDGLTISLKDGRSFRLTKPGTSLRVTSTRGGVVGSAKVGPMSGYQQGAIKALKGKVQNGQLANQRNAIIQQKLISSGILQALSEQGNTPQLGKSIRRIVKAKRNRGARRARRRMIRRRRKLN